MASPKRFGNLFRRNLGFLLGIALPVAVTATYFFGIATPRYVSETQFVVRQAAATENFGGLSSFLKTTGLGSGADNSSIIRAYVTSRAALEELEKTLPVRDHYKNSGADFLSSWPSIIHGETNEQFYNYFRKMIDVRVDPYTGVLVLTVETFSPEFSQKVALNLVGLAETRINEINERVAESTLGTAQLELEQSELRLSEIQVKIALFRQTDRILDPTQSVAVLGALLKNLASELSSVNTAIQNLQKNAPNSPRLPSLIKQSEALDNQISQVRIEYSGEETGYSKSISEFEKLELQHEFALNRLAFAIASYSTALSQTNEQRLFLERFVSPNLPDKSTEPKRFLITLTVFGWASLFYLVAWLMISGLREHAIQ